MPSKRVRTFMIQCWSVVKTLIILSQQIFLQWEKVSELSLLHERPGCNQIVGRHFLSTLGMNLKNWEILFNQLLIKIVLWIFWLIFYNKLLSFKYMCFLHHLMKAHQKRKLGNFWAASFKIIRISRNYINQKGSSVVEYRRQQRMHFKF